MRMTNCCLVRSTYEAEAGGSSPGLFQSASALDMIFLLRGLYRNNERRYNSRNFLKTIVRVLGEQQDFDEFLSIPRIESEKTRVQLECASGL
jgi:hypothetical protein